MNFTDASGLVGNIQSIFTSFTSDAPASTQIASTKLKPVRPIAIPQRTRKGNSPMPIRVESYDSEDLDSSKHNSATFNPVDISKFMTDSVENVTNAINNIFTGNNLFAVQSERLSNDSNRNSLRNYVHTTLDTKDELYEIIAKYDIVQYLGKGAYGKVYEAIDRRDGTRVAIKHMKKILVDPFLARRVFREINILRNLDNPYIIHIHDAICPKLHLADSSTSNKLNDIFVVFPFMDTDLEKIIKDEQFLHGDNIKIVMYQLLKAMKYMHSANVIHRDLKPANIMVNCKENEIKIIDFGLARVVDAELVSEQTWDLDNATRQDIKKGFFGTSQSDSDDDNDNDESKKNDSIKRGFGPSTLKRSLSTHVITRWYRAPEVILSQPYTGAVDVWAIGCIFAELLGMQIESQPNYLLRRPLFPGHGTANLGNGMPLSDQSDGDYDINDILGGENGQMMTIFKVIGTPTTSDLEFLDVSTATKLRTMDKIQPKNFKTIYPGADSQALDLLSCLLRFNPNKRASVNEALSHPYFASVRQYSLEHVSFAPMSSVEPDNESLESVLDCIRTELQHYDT